MKEKKRTPQAYFRWPLLIGAQKPYGRLTLERCRSRPVGGRKAPWLKHRLSSVPSTGGALRAMLAVRRPR